MPLTPEERKRATEIESEFKSQYPGVTDPRIFSAYLVRRLYEQECRPPPQSLQEFEMAPGEKIRIGTDADKYQGLRAGTDEYREEVLNAMKRRGVVALTIVYVSFEQDGVYITCGPEEQELTPPESAEPETESVEAAPREDAGKKEESAEEFECPACGSSVKDEDVICPKCGVEFEDDTSGDEKVGPYEKGSPDAVYEKEGEDEDGKGTGEKDGEEKVYRDGEQ